MKLRGILVANLLALFATAPGYGYPWPVFPSQGGSLEGPSPINAVLGEYRDTAIPSASCAAPCPHFHDGVDIRSSEDSSVYPSVSGSVPKTGGLGSQLVVVNSANGIIRYVHVIPDPDLQTAISEEPQGGSVDVTASETLLGAVNSEAHVHFGERDVSNTNFLNSLRAGGLDNYLNTALPTVSNIALFDAQNPGSAPLGTVVPAGTQITIRAHAQDAQSLGSSDTGIYQIGYQIFSADGSQLLQNNFPMQTYDSIPNTWFYLPQEAYDTTISQGYANGVLNAFYFASNNPNPNTAATPLDLTQSIFSGGGTYQLCVLAKDIQGNGGNVGSNPPQGVACVSFKRSIPLISVEDVAGVVFTKEVSA